MEKERNRGGVIVLCFKDKTFCTADGCANRHSCDRYFTKELHDEAVKWWGSEDYPIAYYTQPPKSCYKKED